ncbi:MAG: (d)CMP kinase, partial [Candidatus Eremiobacteraeota bacterium]|nr:(d)CMP kinase [Candidatus Eremiobacteraeota bacterium]
MSVTPLQIAIDGPAASGKTTVARRVAARLQLAYLDTGAMYRALAYLALETHANVRDGTALAALVDRANAQRYSEALLQSNDVNAVVSIVAAHPEVREAMVAAQRRIAGDESVVMAGRDIGTVVLPNAPVKIYLTASVDARVDRRRMQLEEAGANVDAAQLRQELERRDRLDRTRAVSPLEPARDAHVIDSSDLSVEQVVDAVGAIVA